MINLFPTQKIENKMFNDFKHKDQTAHDDKIYCLKWNNTGTHLASGSEDCSLKVWSNEKGGLDKVCDFRDHTKAIDQLAWHPDSPDVLCSVSPDATLRVWDIRLTKKNNIKTLKTGGPSICLAWSPDGNTIAIVHKDTEIQFYDFKTMTQVKSAKFEGEQINDMAWDLTGNIFLVATEGGQSGSVIVLDGKTLSLPKLDSLEFHRGASNCISMDPTNNYCATGAADALIAIWDLTELVAIKSFSKENSVRQLSFSHDGRYLAAASEESRFDIFDVHNNQEVWKHDCNGAQLAVAWNPKKYLVAFTCEAKEKLKNITLAGLKVHS